LEDGGLLAAVVEDLPVAADSLEENDRFCRNWLLDIVDKRFQLEETRIFEVFNIVVIKLYSDDPNKNKSKFLSKRFKSIALLRNVLYIVFFYFTRILFAAQQNF
jgi:hypothetical protein